MVKKSTKKSGQTSKKSKPKDSSKSNPKVALEKDSNREISSTMKLTNERDIAMDFANKVYKEFDKMIKSVVFFGSGAKKVSTRKSDIDIIIIIDDVAIFWDIELIGWYRGELGKLIKKNPYIKPLHINTVKLSTWWEDLLRGDPVIMNVLRYGEALIDFGGFFDPLKGLLKQGKIKSTPESVYTLLERAPTHLVRARRAMHGVVDGIYWTMVDAAHAALISADAMPPSPEKIPEILTETFVNKKRLNKKYVLYYKEIFDVTKKITHGGSGAIYGKELDDWFKKAEDFLREMARLVEELIEEKRIEG